MKSQNLTLTDFIKYIEGDLGKSEWITIFDFVDYDLNPDKGTFFSALVNNSKVKEVIDKYEWDLRIGEGLPDLVTRYIDGKPVTEYCRFSDEGIEPIVYWRSFSGKKERYVEVSEEFRLYFNLYEKILNNQKKVLIHICDDGEEVEVVRIENNTVFIKLKYIKTYLAAKQMNLAIYFEAMRFSKKNLQELNIAETNEVIKGKGFTYSICIRNLNYFHDNTKSQGWIIGKKLIEGAKDFNPFLETKDREFEDFITGVDENGNEIICCCNTDYQDAPGFLTPIFFKREVLKKYYDSPDRYSVEDGYVQREGFWSLRVLNNHTEHVVAWLGDLKSLPYKEQTYWRAYNVTPSTRKISHADFTRNIEGNFADPEHPEFYFKYKFSIFQKAWHSKFGWYLFKPLSPEDAYHLKSLHIPTTSGQKEFDDQIASITKILIDSLNEEKLIENLIIEKENPRGIDKLEIFLNAQRIFLPEMIEFIRKLQTLRSTGVAHRKGKNYKEVKKFFKIDDKELPVVFDDILIKSIWVLNTLENYFLK